MSGQSVSHEVQKSVFITYVLPHISPIQTQQYEGILEFVCRRLILHSAPFIHFLSYKCFLNFLTLPRIYETQNVCCYGQISQPMENISWFRCLTEAQTFTQRRFMESPGGQETRHSSLGFNVLPKDTSTCRSGVSNQRPADNKTLVPPLVYLFSFPANKDVSLLIKLSCARLNST